MDRLVLLSGESLRFLFERRSGGRELTSVDASFCFLSRRLVKVRLSLFAPNFTFNIFALTCRFASSRRTSTECLLSQPKRSTRFFEKRRSFVVLFVLVPLLSPPRHVPLADSDMCFVSQVTKDPKDSSAYQSRFFQSLRSFFLPSSSPSPSPSPFFPPAHPTYFFLPHPVHVAAASRPPTRPPSHGNTPPLVARPLPSTSGRSNDSNGGALFDIAEANGPAGVDLMALDQQLDGEGGSGWPFVSTAALFLVEFGRREEEEREEEEGDAFETLRTDSSSSCRCGNSFRPISAKIQLYR